MAATHTRPDWLVAAAAKAAAAAPMAAALIPDRVLGRTVHIDGDYLAYRCAGSSDCPANIARQNVRDKVQALIDMSGATQAVVHLTAPDSHKGERHLISTARPYQGHRKGGKPANWAMLRDWLDNLPWGYATGFEVRHWRDREADDGMAQASWCADNPLQDCVIASPDKDMRMLAGLHIDFHDYTLTEVPKRAFEAIGENGKVYGHKWFWLQMLQGDTADNIPGLPRAEGKLCGEKTANKYLAGATNNVEAYLIVRDLYRGTYADGWADALVEQAALLWLRGDACASIWHFLNVVPRTVETDAATRRLITRVKESRAEIDRIADRARAGQDEGAARG